MFWLSFLLWNKETMNEEALPQKPASLMIVPQATPAKNTYSVREEGEGSRKESGRGGGEESMQLLPYG